MHLTPSRREAPLTFAGHALRLLPERAIAWPVQRALLLADMHLGKPAAFAAAGIPVPRGTIEADLARLDAALDVSGAEHLLILGDLLHARSGMDAHTRAVFAAWRERWPGLRITLIRGNHDVSAGDPPGDWRIEVVDEPFAFAGVDLRHVPAPVRSAAPSIAGHVHPVVMLEGPGRTSERAPCFHLTRASITLPAFGSFTGGRAAALAEGDRVFAVGDGAVIEIPGVVVRGRSGRAAARR